MSGFGAVAARRLRACHGLSSPLEIGDSMRLSVVLWRIPIGVSAVPVKANTAWYWRGRQGQYEEGRHCRRWRGPQQDEPQEE